MKIQPKYVALCCAAMASLGLLASAEEGVPNGVNAADYYTESGEACSIAPVSLQKEFDVACDVKGGKDDCDAKGCDECCECSCYLFGPDEAWTLLKEDECRRWNFYGWAAMGTTTNHDNPINPAQGAGNLPQTFNYRNDEFQMNQVYGVLERETDTECGCWDWGGRVDVLYGEDYIFTQAVGLETRPNAANHWNTNVGGNGIGGTGRLGLALPQAYGEVAYENLKFKVGHFYTIIGYEVVPATGNFFYSHAWTMQYSEPFTHSGGLLTWEGDQLTLHAGAVNGWDKFDAVSDRAAFLGGVTYTPCHERYTLAYAVITGDEDGANEVAPGVAQIAGNRTMMSLVLDWNINDCWEYVLHCDYGWQENGVMAGQDAEWYAVNQYLFYTINDCLKAGVRAEWFNDDDGFRVPVFNPRVPMGTIFPGHYYGLTAGLNYKPHANITLRPEARWNWFDGHTPVPNGIGPFSDDDPPTFVSDEQFTLGVDAIITF